MSSNILADRCTNLIEPEYIPIGSDIDLFLVFFRYSYVSISCRTIFL
ncbi:hypothetical protein L861_02180 [Litchfieldella anticariensis FP35 = DSM 16096]|uniref:Uncharacterized protein n=1 Tax=Litchfieldella anticariensis (strain DSM 16096 / CECT 5854 / CIP 108499 / LMG 22089 / FP35) TaxID=1121939 RepID=S2LHK9_LITA3|nr:hypothetical protein L861_02180 [Halomonas anticariensis FP35 = DSM 16096]